jgi:ubiquinone/menaquinone biosynthesis C-methylase UbiE
MGPLQADDVILAGQVEYYRARAAEYDRWFFRQGRYDRGPAATATWFRELDEVRAALSAVPLDGGRVLELAPGTGIWTQLIAARAASVVALDASAEMLERCRARLGAAAARVELTLGDIFAWEPAETFDAVVFCFWLVAADGVTMTPTVLSWRA